MAPLTRVYPVDHRYPLVAAGTPVTILALGRGVNRDGTLTDEVKRRVQAVLQMEARLVANGHTVRIIWTGDTSRKNISRGVRPAKTEAHAMFDYANTLATDHTIDQIVEPDSTNTVENMVFSAKHFLPGSTLLVMSDDLHFWCDRVGHIVRLCFPKHESYQITVGRHVRGLKARLTQLASTVVLMVSMFNVEHGNLDAIQARQDWLNRLFMWRQPRQA